MAAIISLVFGFIELLVGLRFIFLLLGANPSAWFVMWVYNTSAPLVTPFAGILGHPTTVPAGAAGAIVHSVFDPSTLVAFIVYAVVGGIIVTLFRV
jgi:hypothetical protein